MEFGKYYMSGSYCGGPPTSSPKCKLDEIAEKSGRRQFGARKCKDCIHREAALRVTMLRNAEAILNAFLGFGEPTDHKSVHMIVAVLEEKACAIQQWCEAQTNFPLARGDKKD